MKGYEILDKIPIGVFEQYSMYMNDHSLAINLNYQHVHYIACDLIKEIRDNGITVSFRGKGFHYTVWKGNQMIHGGMW